MRRSPFSSEGGPRGYTAADLEIDFDTRKVRANGKDVRLTPKEFETLRYLVAHTGRPVTHREILQAVWGPDYGAEPEYLRVFVNQLRKKIEANPGKPKYIITEPWVGYRFVARSFTKYTVPRYVTDLRSDPGCWRCWARWRCCC
jgi:two-component system KDP operon response regulator KdpE